MQKGDIRLIALDLDGTLLNREQVISQANARALARAAEQGIHIAINSGRAAFEIDHLLSDLPDVTPHIIGLNGAQTRIGGREEKLIPLGAEAFLACYDICEQAGAQCFFYTDDTVYTNREIRGEHPHTKRILHEGIERLADRVIKFVADSPDPVCVEAFRRGIAPLGLSAQSSWHTNIEVNAPGIDKGYGLKLLAEALDIPLSQVMAAGDQENDLPMLRIAGYPVAMGNAIPAVKDIARHVTASNADDGVAMAIHTLLGWEP